MKQIKYVITDSYGMHARPAGLLVKEAKKTDAKVTIEWNGKTADATKLMSIMSLGAKKGSEIVVKAEGDDEDEAIMNLEAFLKSHL